MLGFLAAASVAGVIGLFLYRNLKKDSSPANPADDPGYAAKLKALWDKILGRV
jgi:hypothetical protein